MSIMSKINVFQSASTWIHDIMIVCETSRASMKGKIVEGYIQRCNVAPDFCLTLQCEEQIDAIKRIPESDRFLQIDSSGGLIKITKFMNPHYSRVSYIIVTY